MSYKAVPDPYDFSSEFNTYIIAFCPDTHDWFVTKQRFFFYEYSKEFETFEEAEEYFLNNQEEFLDIQEKMKDNIDYYCFLKGKLYLDGKLICEGA